LIKYYEFYLFLQALVKEQFKTVDLSSTKVGFAKLFY